MLETPKATIPQWENIVDEGRIDYLNGQSAGKASREMTRFHAYLLGAYLGDGHVAHRHKYNRGNKNANGNHQFTIASIDKDLLKRTKRCIKKCFPKFEGSLNINRAARNGKQKGYIYRLDIYNKELCDFLIDTTNWKKKLPKFSNKKLFREFVAGLMDTDGWIAENFSRTEQIWKWQMGFAVNLPWLKYFKIQLEKFGVHSGSIQRVTQKTSPNWVDCYRIYINIRDFINAGLYFRVKRKRQRLVNYQRHYGLTSA